MSMSTGDSGGVTSEINVTPMIDVLLVLLIIFMIVQALKRAAVDIQIPAPEKIASTNAPSVQIVLELRDDGSYVINGQAPTPKDQLDRKFHEIYDQRPAKLLFVKPGQNRVYADVIEAIDIARGAGVEVVGFTPAETPN
jgi:biopolymer transport protein ExbD